MDITTMTSAIARASSAGALPDLPIVHQTEVRRPYIIADLSVSFSAVLEAASNADAPSLEIYCDTLVVQGMQRLDQNPGRISIVCRRVVGEDGTMMLSHFEETDRTAVRLICGSIEGDFQIISNNPAGKHIFDLSKAYMPRAVPRFANFVFMEGAPQVVTSAFPEGLLEDGQPLHRLLSADFSLAANVLSFGDEAPVNANCAADILRWLASWSGVKDDVAQIARHAERLRNLVPYQIDETLTYPVPDRTAADYLQLAKARSDYARTVRVDEKFLEQAGTVADIAKEFAESTVKRDMVDIAYIKKEVEILLGREPALYAALQKSAKAVEQYKFEQVMTRIDLDLAIELDRIDKIVKASFDIAIGVITLGASIAAICLGVPADPGASAKKDIEGVQGLADAVRDNWKSTKGMLGNLNHISNLMLLYKIPFTFIWKNKSAMQDSFAALIKSGVSIKSAAGTIASSGALHGTLDEVVKALNEAQRGLANKPGVIEARAAWDAIELETVNQLDRVINDSETAAGIKDAATAYKTAVQKMAIYGRAMAEQQAMIDANQRDIAARLLQRCGHLAKQNEAQDLVHTMQDRAALNAHMQADLDRRVSSAARSFYVASYGFRRAQFFETYSVPGTLIALSTSTKDMAGTFAGLSTDHSDAANMINTRQVSFKEELRFDDPAEIERLLNGKAISWRILPDQVSRQSFTRLRLQRVSLRLETPDDPKGIVRFELSAPGGYTDRSASGVLQFAGAGVSVPYDYDATGVRVESQFNGVKPIPFADWMLTLLEHGGAGGVTGVTLQMEGWAFS